MRFDFPKDFKLMDPVMGIYKYVGEEPWEGQIILNQNDFQLQCTKNSDDFIINNIEIKLVD